MGKICSAWTWVKDHLLWILGGLVVVLGAILAVKHEKDKIRQYKVKAKVQETKADVLEIRNKVSRAEGREEGLAVADKVLDGVDERHEEKIKAIREDADDKSASDVASGLNDLYRR